MNAPLEKVPAEAQIKRVVDKAWISNQCLSQLEVELL